ncbi:MAG TPA: hypothetical protein ENG95_00730 [Nitrospirae bacterium]|nr:hypothetical protein [Nitrospirota bacterium]HDK16454.1 hypothetical protein [Nitrospirota bacterium]HDO25151.1 hypothetical protein [Nitrospirota bacterium]HDZ83925.1 hypothetical protein [Nitrospirota bacterium]
MPFRACIVSLSNECGPAWSPDGKRIAFLTTRDGNPEIYVMNAECSNQKRLTRNDGRCFFNVKFKVYPEVFILRERASPLSSTTFPKNQYVIYIT